MKLSFKRGVTESAQVTEVGPGRFRLETTALSSFCLKRPAFMGDVVEVEPSAEDVYRILRVAERSGRRVGVVLIPAEVTASPELEGFKAEVGENGGEWEQFFGGIMILHMPRGSAFNAKRRLEVIIRQITAGSRTGSRPQ